MPVSLAPWPRPCSTMLSVSTSRSMHADAFTPPPPTCDTGRTGWRAACAAGRQRLGLVILPVKHPFYGCVVHMLAEVARQRGWLLHPVETDLAEGGATRPPAVLSDGRVDAVEVDASTASVRAQVREYPSPSNEGPPHASARRRESWSSGTRYVGCVGRPIGLAAAGRLARAAPGAGRRAVGHVRQGDPAPLLLVRPRFAVRASK
jgi:hypothetical protein